MTRIMTSGTSSCAFISISGFREADIQLEIDYQSNRKKTRGVELKGGYANCGDAAPSSLGEFYSRVLLPLSQPMGKTLEYSFSEIMDCSMGRGPYKSNSSNLGTKLTILTLNAAQEVVNGGFWGDLVLSYGFKKVDETYNSNGMRCSLYTRNVNRLEKNYKYPDE